MIPTRDPGTWFAHVVEALGKQDYPALAVTIVHAPGDREMLERHESELPAVTYIEEPEDAGFGAKVNRAVEQATEPLVVVLHDDVAMEVAAVSALVREYLRRRDPRTLVAAKLLDWTDPKRLMPAGFDADRFGMTTSLVKHGDLDQGQQDRIVDLFGTSTACVLANREVFVELGGFDEAMDWHGEAHDLAVRYRATRGQVVIASAARARHRGAFEQRDHVGPTFRERRHQMRSVLASSPARALPGLLLSYVALHVVEAVVSIARLDLADVASIVDGWLWNLRNLGSLRSRRLTLVSNEAYAPDALKLLRRRGSIRLSESLDRRITQREDAAESGDESISAIRIGGAIVVGVLLAFGARHLLTRPIPVVGEFRTLPEDLGTLTTDWLTGWRTWGMGSEGFASFALPLLDVAGVATFGAEGLLRTLLVVAPIPIGVIGMWRLFSHASAKTAPAAAAAMYAASPLPYNAVSNGSLTALVLYALLPWMLRNLASVAQSPIFGPPRTRLAAAIALAALMAIAIAVLPFASVLIVLVIVGVVVGSLLSGDMRGVIPLVIGSVIALGIGVVLNWPYISGMQTWERFASSQSNATTDVALVDLLTLDTGPVGLPLIGWAMFAPALLGLVSGAGLRFSWAMRIWGFMLCTWGVIWASAWGLLPVGLPQSEVMLTPVALGFGALGGLAAMVVEVDLAEAKAWRFVPVVVAVLGFCVAMFPLIDASGNGRWEMAQTDLTTTYGALGSEPTDGSFRVVWIGDAHVLGAAALPTANDLAWTTSFDGTMDIRALWGGPNTGATAELGDAISAGLDGRTSRLGRELARFGVRYVVVMDQQAPVPETALSEVVSDFRAVGLNAQLDLVRTGVVNPAVTVFNNTAWAPVHSAVAPTALDPLRITDAQPAVVERTGAVTFEGQTRAERDVYASWEPSPRWTLRSGESVVARIDVGSVGMGFASSDVADTTDAVFSYQTADSHTIIVYLQAAGWIVLFAVRRWAIGVARRDRRRDLAVAERVG